jgi:hypothetical protein
MVVEARADVSGRRYVFRFRPQWQALGPFCRISAGEGP